MSYIYENHRKIEVLGLENTLKSNHQPSTPSGIRTGLFINWCFFQSFTGIFSSHLLVFSITEGFLLFPWDCCKKEI